MNQKGFALAITMALLPFLLGLFLLLFAILGVNQFNLSTQQACREGGLRGQQHVAPLLQQLLSLNPRALKLKLAELQAQAKLAAALSTGNLPAAAAARTEIASIQLQRKVLDFKQKSLIQQSNLFLLSAHQRTASSLRVARTQGLPTFNYLKIESRQHLTSAPKLAVRPESSDIAPTYRTLENFDSEQALAHSWQYQLRVRSPFQNFLMADLKWTPSCAVTLKQDGFSWIPKIKKVKSW
ncbi:hypothetical protein D3C87_1261550 [compost metagenome]